MQNVHNVAWDTKKRLCPARVKEVCKKDRSIAIAHGPEEICEVQSELNDAKAKRRSKKNS